MVYIHTLIALATGCIHGATAYDYVLVFVSFFRCALYIYIVYTERRLTNSLFVVLFVACFISPSPGVVVPLSASMSRQEAVLGKEEMTKRMQMQQVN